jgi:hypothetical protein
LGCGLPGIALAIGAKPLGLSLEYIGFGILLAVTLAVLSLWIQNL